MNDSKQREYSEKYVRDGSRAVITMEKNPFRQMKTDTFKLSSDPDFGGVGGGVEWSYIHEPVDMFPGMALSDSPRHITILGGSAVNYLELRGEVEITLGTSRDDLKTYKYNEAVSAYIKPGMLYDINITKVDDAGFPIHFNEFVYGGSTPKTGESGGNGGGYEKYIVSGEDLWAKGQPHHEVIYPVISTGTFRHDVANEPIRRTWMPVSVPHVLAEKAHYHEFLEYIVFYGSDPDDISDLGGVVEFTIGEDKDNLTVFSINKSTQFFIKPGLWHSPMVFKEIKDPNKPVVLCEVSYAAGFGDDFGKTVWIDGVPPVRPDPAS